MAGDVLMAFNDTMLQSFDFFCPNGSCIEQGAMMAEQSFNVTGILNGFFANDDLKDIAASAAQGVASLTMEEGDQADMQAVDMMLHADSVDEAQQMAEQQGVEFEAPSGEDLLGLLGSWFGW